MNPIVARLREPSSWAALSGLFSAAAIFFPHVGVVQAAGEVVSQVGAAASAGAPLPALITAAVAAVAGIVLPERPVDRTHGVSLAPMEPGAAVERVHGVSTA